LPELRDSPSHSIKQLFFYAVTAEAEPTNFTPIFIDISAPELVAAWKAAMQAHATQVAARNYIELQILRAQLLGARSGVSHAMAFFPNEPLLFGSLAQAGAGARKF
jgi:LmbE family N-acetylglucosaminyl deacetylase